MRTRAHRASRVDLRSFFFGYSEHTIASCEISIRNSYRYAAGTEGRKGHAASREGINDEGGEIDFSIGQTSSRQLRRCVGENDPARRHETIALYNRTTRCSIVSSNVGGYTDRVRRLSSDTHPPTHSPPPHRRSGDRNQLTRLYVISGAIGGAHFNRSRARKEKRVDEMVAALARCSVHDARL